MQHLRAMTSCMPINPRPLTSVSCSKHNLRSKLSRDSLFFARVSSSFQYLHIIFQLQIEFTRCVMDVCYNRYKFHLYIAFQMAPLALFRPSSHMLVDLVLGAF